MGEKNWPVSRLLRHSPSPGDTSAFFSPSSVPQDGEPWWNPPSTPGSQTGRSSLTPGPVLVLARPGLRSAPVLGQVSVWPDSPSGNPICVFFHSKVSLTVNPCLPCDRASVRFCWQPSSLLLGRICPRVQSYVILPQAWASPYQCLHMLPPFRAGCGLRSALLWKARFPAVTTSCNNK